jgi:hypothetical protein
MGRNWCCKRRDRHGLATAGSGGWVANAFSRFRLSETGFEKAKRHETGASDQVRCFSDTAKIAASAVRGLCQEGRISLTNYNAKDVARVVLGGVDSYRDRLLDDLPLAAGLRSKLGLGLLLGRGGIGGGDGARAVHWPLGDDRV